MPVTSLATLKAAVATWLGGSSDPGFLDSIDLAINFTCADLSRRLRVPEMIKRARFTVSNQWENLPPDFAAMRLCYLSPDDGTETTLPALTEERLTVAGQRGYCLSGLQIRLAPFTPGDQTKVKIIYWSALTPSDTDNVFRATVSAYPDLLLYGTLTQMEGYLIDDSRLGTWNTLYEQRLMTAKKAAAKRASTYAN